MSTKRIFAALAVSLLVFLGLSILEERETFSGLLYTLAGMEYTGTSQNSPDRSANETGIHDTLEQFNAIVSKASMNGIPDILQSLPATQSIKDRITLDITMAMRRDLPKPLTYKMRVMDIFFSAPDKAVAICREDWQYSDSSHAPASFSIKLSYSVMKSGNSWLVEEILPDNPFLEAEE